MSEVGAPVFVQIGRAQRAATAKATCHGSGPGAGAGTDAPVIALGGAPHSG